MRFTEAYAGNAPTLSAIGLRRILLLLAMLYALALYTPGTSRDRDAISQHVAAASTLRLEVILVAWNEAHILPYTVRFYQARFPSHSLLLTIYDNESDDGTKALAQKLGCAFVSYSTGGTFNDGVHMRIKNEAWKNSTAEWIIVADVDEWIDTRPTDLDTYEAANATFVRAEGAILVWPEDTMDLSRPAHALYEHDEPRALGYSKPVLFHRRAITDTGIIPGAHMAYPTGQVTWLSDVQPPIPAPRLYHAKYFDVNHSIDRSAAYAGRMSQDNRQHGWSAEYFEVNRTAIAEEFVRLRNVAKPVSTDLF